jgi:hypothetical protein
MIGSIFPIMIVPLVRLAADSHLLEVVVCRRFGLGERVEPPDRRNFGIRKFEPGWPTGDRSRDRGPAPQNNIGTREPRGHH